MKIKLKRKKFNTFLNNMALVKYNDDETYSHIMTFIFNYFE